MSCSPCRKFFIFFIVAYTKEILPATSRIRHDTHTMMQGGENNVDVALGRQLQGIQRERSARKKRSEALQTAFEQRIQESERKEAQFYDLDVRVEESQITNPFGRDARGDENFVFYGAEFDSDTSKGYDPTWVAVTNGVFDEMMLSKKDAKARNSINGKNVRGVGPGGRRVFLVRAAELRAFLHKEESDDEAVVMMRDLVNDLKRKIKNVWHDVRERNQLANAYLQANPEQAERLKRMIEVRNSELGPKSTYKPPAGKGCDMHSDGVPRMGADWEKQNHGTPKSPIPIDDFPERREKKDGKYHKAFMVLDKDLKATCVSPETMGRSGRSFAEEMAPNTYHHVTDVVKLQRKKPLTGLDGEEMSEEKIWGDMVACAQYGGDDADKCGSAEARQYPLSDDMATPSALCKFVEDTGNDSTPSVCAPKWLDNKETPKEWKDLYYGPNGVWLREVQYVEEEMKRKVAGLSGLTAKQRVKARRMAKTGRVSKDAFAKTRYVKVPAARRSK